MIKLVVDAFELMYHADKVRLCFIAQFQHY